MTTDPTLQRVIDFYQDLTPDTVADLNAIYSADIHFRDPFHDVTGIPAVTKIFQRMFEQVDAPRFVVTTASRQADDAFLIWTFSFFMRGKREEQHFPGASHLRFSANDLVCLHHDYWDVATGIYEKLPVIGSTMRLLSRAMK